MVAWLLRGLQYTLFLEPSTSAILDLLAFGADPDVVAVVPTSPYTVRI